MALADLEAPTAWASKHDGGLTADDAEHLGDRVKVVSGEHPVAPVGHPIVGGEQLLAPRGLPCPLHLVARSRLAGASS